MAKTINISYKGESAAFAYKPIDRAVLYGKRRRVAFDEAGNECAKASLLADGSLLIRSGMTAPVVFVSMVTSSSEDLPRGIEFLLSPNRLNVAISRAQWACFILRSPHLAIMEATSPDGMVMLGKFVTPCR